MRQAQRRERDPSQRIAPILGVGLLVLLTLLFLIDDALPYFVFTELAYGRFWDRSEWLLLHVFGGLLALLTGPFQLWSGFRRRHIAAHQWMGRLYVASVVVSSVTALNLSFHTESWTFGVALFVGSTVWLITTSAALVAAVRRRLEAHREWVIRSYILTFTFVSFRLILEIPWFEELGAEAEISTTVTWLCWIVPLLTHEFVRNNTIQAKNLTTETTKSQTESPAITNSVTIEP
jgi:hypothetical protein